MDAGQIETQNVEGPEEQDFTWNDRLNGRELAQLIVGTLSGREQLHFRVRIDEGRFAAVVAALVQAGWTVSQNSWGGVDKAVVLDVTSD